MSISKMQDRKNQQGIALVLSVLILANLFIITFIIADIVIRVGQSGQKIGRSEIAYLAAETAIEQSIYDIESSRSLSGLGTSNIPVTDELDNTDGTWEKYVDVIDYIPIICVDDQQNVTFPDEVDNDLNCIYPENYDPDEPSTKTITATNPLKIRLQPDTTFQLELDFDFANVAYYPSSIDITWSPSNPEGNIILLDQNAGSQFVGNTGDPQNPDYINQLSISGMNSEPQRIKITNQKNPYTTYTVTPSLDNNLPLGILVHAEGNYSNEQQRILEVERRLWQIY